MRKAMLAILCLILSIGLTSPAISEAGEEHTKALDEIFARFHTMGASVAVFQNGQITYTYAYGLADRKNELPATPDTLYQIGSISKLISNIGLMQLYEQGLFTLEDDMQAILGVPIRNPEYPDTPITVRQVLSHTAGLCDSGYYNLALYGKDMTLTKMFTGNRAKYQFTKGLRAGRHYDYCNFGGGLIGSLIEKLSGLTVEEYMHEHVFAPLGIQAAYQPQLLDKSLLVAKQYDMDTGDMTNNPRLSALPAHDTPDPERAFVYTAGKLTLSAPDLAKLLIALCDEGIYQDTRLLKPSTVQRMLERQDHIGSVDTDAGCGLCVAIVKDAEVEGRTMYGHGGKANGMLCAAYFDPSDRTGVVMLTNGCDCDEMYQGVGSLGRIALSYCYNHIIGPKHRVVSPFLVVGE